MTAILFDTETHDRDNPEIIEAAWMELILSVEFTDTDTKGIGTLGRTTVKCQRFQSSKPITLGAMATHNIMDEDLVGCDPSAMFELPPCDYVIAHNVDFDVQAASAMDGPKRICTCALARALWPDLDCYSQAALIYHLDRPNARERLKGAHGAAADVLLCKTILDAEIAKTGAQSWEELWQISEEARLPKKMYWGKHVNVALEDLPRDYVAWLLRLPDLDPYLRKALTTDPRQRTMFCPQ